MCHLEQLTTTDRVLLGQHVAVTAPDVRRAREYVTRVAQELKAAGLHVHHSIGKVVIDNGGTLESFAPAELRHGRESYRLDLGPTGETITRV